MKRFLLSIGLSLILLGMSYGQTTLSAGDVVLSVFNSDGDDDIYFVLLKDIESGTIIKFTDNGWLPETGAFETDEGILTWTATTDVAKGTEIPIFDSDGTQTTQYGTIVENDPSFLLGLGGDQITIFQGTIGSPTNLYYFDNSTNGLEVTDAAITANDDSGLPSGLTAGTNAYVHGAHSDDNYQYNCPLISDASISNVLAAFMNSANYDSESSLGTYASTNCNFSDASISGDAGWRLLSLPITGGDVEDISDDTPVQGIADGDDSGATTNFILYQSGNSFTKPSNVSTTWGDGFGFGLYFYNNTTNGSSTLPVTLDVTGSEPSSNVVVNLNTTASGSTGGSGASDSKYTLVGNPFASNFDLSSFTVSAGTGIQDNVHFWNDGSGSYSAIDRTSTSGYVVAPWQGFWVEVLSSESATQITFPTSGKTTSSVDGTFFSKQLNNKGDISFTLSSENTYDEAIRLAFREYATTAMDNADASKFTPLIPNYATMAFASDNRLKSVESLPYNLEEEVTLSLQPQLVGVDGEFTFGWNGLETIPGEWELILHDYDTGENIDMRAASEYVFTAGAQAKANPNPLSLLSGPAAVAMKAKADANRFGITIRPTSVSNETEDSPAAFALEQNYPNPFNPSTTISYSVQEAGAVSIIVYNLMGQKVATLLDETKAAGQYNVRWNAAGAASGMYYYRLEAGGQSITRKMTLIK